MSIKYLIILSTIILVSACNEEKNDVITKKDVQTCYQYIKNNDTIILRTVKVSNFITGMLEYNLFGKDKNQGTILGQMKGDLLVADYTFISKGIQFVRQVVFKKMGNSFVEGYGGIDNINGKDYFKNIDSLKFKESMVLTAFGCGK
jgi:hypothetical protein